jgi:hypothetical protein
MPVDSVRLREYFAPSADAFWSWDDDGQTVVWHDGETGWRDGTTLAFRPEVLAMLRQLAPRGWPPLDAVVLLLAACRDTWAVFPEWTQGGLLPDWARQPAMQAIRDRVSEVLHGLDVVHGLSPALRQSVEAKASLAAIIFESSRPYVPPAEAAEMLVWFETGLTAEEMARYPHGSIDRARSTVYALMRGLVGLDATALERLLRTGLEQPLTPAPIEVPPPAPVPDLLTALEDDPELAPIARLARRLRAVVHLPRGVSQRDELALGGVSDITNRGPLDRLLISELAHDDLTLATRVAMNQALYVRREAPPSNPIRRRHVLLDAGIRLWGVPRVFAAAVGLTLAQGADPRQAARCWRVAGAAVEPVDLTTAEGVAAHMARLDHQAHPGAALPAWCRAIDEQSGRQLAGLRDGRLKPGLQQDGRLKPGLQQDGRLKPGLQQDGRPMPGLQRGEEIANDLVLVTGADVWADPDFQRALEQAAAPAMYVATVARDGRYRLYRRTARGSQPLAEATLDLNDVLTPRPRRPALVDRIQSELPAIFGVDSFPLLVPRPIAPQNSWHVAGFGVLTLTGDRRLLHWSHPDRGPRQLATGLPDGRLHWAAPTASGNLCQAVIGRLSQRGLHVLNVHTETSSVSTCRLELERDQPLAVAGSRDAVFVMFHERINALSAITGKLLAARDRPRFSQLHGPFLRMIHTPRGKWYLLNVDGGKLDLLDVPLTNEHGISVLTIFDPTTTDALLAINAQGGVYELGSDDCKIKSSKHAAPIDLVAVSRDGQRFAISTPSPAGTEARPSTRGRGSWTHPSGPFFPCTLSNRSQPLSLTVFNTVDGSSRIVHTTPEWAVEPHLAEYARPRDVRHRFHCLLAGQDGHLILFGRRGSRCSLTPSADGMQLALVLKHGQVVAQDQSFNDVQSEAVQGFSLRVARWPDGSRAWLDSRGLLHLRSSDPELPECSIVLAEGVTAGWCADGRVWGPKYFHGRDDATPGREIHEQILRPFVERLP